MSFGTTPDAAIGTLCFWRFVLGLGIGGNYPLSATVMSEESTTKMRGCWVAVVFAGQGVGYLVAGTVCMICSSIWYSQDVGGENGRDFCWRTILALGAVAPCFTLIGRLMQPETARYTALVEGNAAQAAELVDPAKAAELANVRLHTRQPLNWGQFLRKYGGPLFGCAATWCAPPCSLPSRISFSPHLLLSSTLASRLLTHQLAQVPSRHCILLAELVPDRRVPEGGLAPRLQHHDGPRGAVRHGAGAADCRHYQVL